MPPAKGSNTGSTQRQEGHGLRRAGGALRWSHVRSHEREVGDIRRVHGQHTKARMMLTRVDVPGVTRELLKDVVSAGIRDGAQHAQLVQGGVQIRCAGRRSGHGGNGTARRLRGPHGGRVAAVATGVVHSVP